MSVVLPPSTVQSTAEAAVNFFAACCWRNKSEWWMVDIHTPNDLILTVKNAIIGTKFLSMKCYAVSHLHLFWSQAFSDLDLSVRYKKEIPGTPFFCKPYTAAVCWLLQLLAQTATSEISYN